MFKLLLNSLSHLSLVAPGSSEFWDRWEARWLRVAIEKVVAEGVDGMFEGKDSLVRDPFRPDELAVCFFFFLGGPPKAE